jgi:uncharacterized protein (TIGR03435 family)
MTSLTHRSTLTVILAFGAVALVSAQTARPQFEVASVRPLPPRAAGAAPTPPSRMPSSISRTPGRFYRGGDSVLQLIQFGYGLNRLQVVGAPDWVRNEYFQIEGTTGGTETEDEMRPMVRTLLEDRFKLVVRREPREARYSALVMARSDRRPGPRLEPCGEGPVESRPIAIPRNAYPIPFSISCEAMTAAAEQASLRLNAIVVDETGLTGRWRFAVFYAGDSPVPDSPPPFPTVLREELGLALESRQGPVEMLVIESVERPSAN